MQMEERPEEAALLIALLEKLLADAAFACSEVEYFAVEETASEFVGQTAGDDASTTSYLSSHVDDEMLVVGVLFGHRDICF